MEEYITKEQAIAAMEQVTRPECFIEDTRKNFVKIIEELPAADVAPIEYASWIEDDYGYARCDFCGYEIAYPEYKTPRCPGCGVIMDGE